MDSLQRVIEKTRAGIHLLLGVVMLLSLALPTAGREQVTIQNTGSNQPRAGDTFLDQGNPTTTNGSLGSFQVQTLNKNNRRAIVQFDLSSLPSVGIKSATLNLHVLTPPSSTRTYNAQRVTSFWKETDASWNVRAAGLLWGAAGGGGDFVGPATDSESITNATTTEGWNITADVQVWYNGSANYGTLISDSSESNASAISTVFSSKEDATIANRPSLTVQFVQNVTNLTAAAGNGTVTLTWSFPAAIGSAVNTESNVGVVILRRIGLPVDNTAGPTDGAVPALCSNVSNATFVFVNASNATSFTDDSSDTCGGPGVDKPIYYKVFMRDNATALNGGPFYSTNGTPAASGSTFTQEISAFPTAGTAYSSSWMVATGSTSLAAPALIPGSIVLGGSQSNLLVGVNANAGAGTSLRSYPPVSVGGSITARSPVIDSGFSSLGKNVVYVAGQDGLVYAIDTGTGQIIWAVNPTGLTTNGFQGAPAVLVKSFLGVSCSPVPTHDVVIVGTRNTGTTTANQIVGLDGNTGTTLWQLIGGSSGNPSMDIINSTPQIDYGRCVAWVTSRSAGGTVQPSLWKVNAATGALLATANLGDADSSPTLTPQGEVVFVGTNAGTLFATNPANATTLASFTGTSDGAVRGFPLLTNVVSPFQLTYSTNTLVRQVTFNTTGNVFTLVWTNSGIASPSTPIGVRGLSTIYVDSSDGKIHELDLAAGADNKQRAVNIFGAVVVGDPSLDVIMSPARIYVSTTDQRVYAFTIPF